MDGKIRYFPDTAGMTVADAASLELGNNFEIEAKGYFDVSSGLGQVCFNKAVALAPYISASGELTSLIFGTLYGQSVV